MESHTHHPIHRVAPATPRTSHRHGYGPIVLSLGIAALVGTILASMPLIASGLSELPHDLSRARHGADIVGTLLLASTVAVAVAGIFYILSTMLYRHSEQDRTLARVPRRSGLTRCLSVRKWRR
jgi:hypothetical protein